MSAEAEAHIRSFEGVLPRGAYRIALQLATWAEGDEPVAYATTPKLCGVLGYTERYLRKCLRHLREGGYLESTYQPVGKLEPEVEYRFPKMRATQTPPHQNGRTPVDLSQHRRSKLHQDLEDRMTKNLLDTASRVLVYHQNPEALTAQLLEILLNSQNGTKTEVS